MDDDRMTAGGSESAMSLRAGIALSRLPYSEVWISYATLGGDLAPDELAERLHGRGPLSAIDHNVLAAALNDHLIDLGLHQPVPYADQLDCAPRPAARARTTCERIRGQTQLIVRLTASVMRQTATIRAEVAVRYERMADNGVGPASEEQREYYRERARRLRMLSRRAQRFAQREASWLTDRGQFH
jgi:hypothetical protein